MITVECKIQAKLETVWETWTNPYHIKNWCFASDDWYVPDAENDLRTGGKFKTVMAAKNKSAGFDFGGEYTNIVKFKKIEYRMPDGRQVIITFTANSKFVTVTESFDPETLNPDEAQRQGWQAILNNFKKYTEKYKLSA